MLKKSFINNKYKNIIIGTGISAMGCAYTLLKKKEQFVIIDAAKNRLFKPEKKITLDNDFTPIKYNLPNHLEILKKKAFGGNSLIWGANCLRMFKSQFKTWPIKYCHLEKYYEQAEKLLEVCHFQDQISQNFKIKKFIYNNRKLYDPFIISKLDKIKKADKNLLIGFARLALSSDCYACMNCFYGCKDDFIFNSKKWFETNLRKNINIKFGLELDYFKYDQKLVKLFFKKDKINYYCENLYLCAGTLSTTQIVLNSYDKKSLLNIKESQLFIIPCFFTDKKIDSKKIQTLSQLHIFSKKYQNIYFELKHDPDLIKKILKKKFLFLYYFIPDFIFKKIYIITGFLPDSYSSEYLQLSNYNKLHEFQWKKKDKSIEKKKIKKELLNIIYFISKKLNFTYFSFLLNIYSKGRSYHLGSSIPMQSVHSKKYIHTDINGRLNFNKNVFICDSSNFPDLPSTSIGLTILANSMRIADKKKKNL
jgi:hypothetical protein